MKSFVVSLLVSCSFVSFSAYGVEDEDDLVITSTPSLEHNKQIASGAEESDAEINLKRERAQGDTKDIPQPSQKKQCTEESKGKPDIEMSDETQARTFVDLPTEVVRIIVQFMPSETQKIFALASKRTHDLVVGYRMDTDSRKLQDTAFVNGPAVETDQAYRFHAAVWYALKQMIILKDEKKQTPALTQDDLYTRAEPISKVATFLSKVFPDYIATQRVLNFLSAGYGNLINTSSTIALIALSSEVTMLAGDRGNTGEQELMRMFFYFTGAACNPLQGFYADREESPAQMGLVKRHYLTLQKRVAVQLPYPPGLGAAELETRNKQRAEDWDFITRYGIVLKVDDFRAAGKVQFDVKNYVRAAEHGESVLSKYPNEVKAYDFRNAAEAQLKAKNYPRAAQLRERVLSKYPNEVKADDFRAAAVAQSYAKNYARVAQLREHVLSKCRNERKVNDFRNAAWAYFTAQNFSRSVELLKEAKEEHDKQQSSSLDKTIFLFMILHSNPNNDAEIKTLLEGDLLKDDEKAIYHSVFRKETKNEILQGIDAYIATPGNAYSKDSLINMIIYQIGWMFHVQAGNSDKAKELWEKMGK